MRRALLYRSRQTGWLETDIIMGRWAADNIDMLSVKELQEYAKIVKVRLMRHSFSKSLTFKISYISMWRLDTDTIRYVWTVQCEILDIFQWINGQTAVPSDIDGPIMKSLQVAFRRKKLPC